MSYCSKCFSQYHDEDEKVIMESFEDYSAGIFNDGDDNPYHNYASALRAIYNPPLYSLYENFEADPAVQQQLFDLGDYQDYYHNLYDDV